MSDKYWVPSGVKTGLIGFEKHAAETINRGLCSACGACVSVCPTKKIAIKIAEPDPEFVGECAPGCHLCSKVCPGSYIPLTELEKMVFGRVRSEDERMFGIYRETYCGYAANPDIHKAGVAGGIVTALLAYGLESGILDCAIVAGWDENEPWKVKPKIATTRDELMTMARSKYSISQSLTALRDAIDRGFKKVGIVALPCHAIALRKMQLHKLKIADSVGLIIGLYCLAHTYIEGTEYAIRDRLGVKLEDVKEYAFRGGDYPGYLEVRTKTGDVKKMDLLALWGMAPTMFIGFPVERCHVCLDHVAELADISAGDVWGRMDLMEEGKRDKAGHTGVFIRTEKGENLFKGAVEANYVKTMPASTPGYKLEEYYVINPGWFKKKVANVVRIRYRMKYGWPVPKIE